MTILYAEDRVAMKSPDAVASRLAFLAEQGREGMFRWVSGDFSTLVDADPYEALYVENYGEGFDKTAGAWVRQRETLDILVDWAGVIKGSASAAAANTMRLQAVVDLAAFTRSGFHFGVGTIFKDLNPVYIRRGVKRILGAGNSRWHQLYNGTQYPSLSQIALYDTGDTTKFFQPYGISSMHGSGASRVNPSASPEAVNNSEYRLQTFCDNVQGVLPLTAGFVIHGTDSDNLRLSGFRVFPAHGGADGLDGYNNWATATAADNWAQNGACHFGIVQDGCAHVYYDDVQCVGHFMRSGLLICASDGRTRLQDNPVSNWAAPYHTRVTNCTLEGWKSLAIRGPDKYAVLALTNNSITIPYSADNPFVAVGPGNLHFRLLTSAFNGPVCAWSSVTQSTLAGHPVFVFSGLSIDPTEHIPVGGCVSPFVAGGGTSHIIVDGGTKIHNMKHPSGHLSYATALTHALPYPDTCIEASGLAMVEMHFRDVDMQPNGEVFIHLHDAQDISFNDCWYERGTSVTWPSGHRTGRGIASPDPGSNIHVPSGHAAGRSYNIRLTSSNIQQSQQIDLAPHWHVQQRNEFAADNGFWEPANDVVPTLATESTPAKYGTVLRPGINRRVGFGEAVYNRFAEDWRLAFWYEHGELGDRVRTAKDIIPNLNGCWDLGSPTCHFAEGFYNGIVHVTTSMSGTIPALGVVSNISGVWVNQVGTVYASRNGVSGIWQRQDSDGQVHQFYRGTSVVGSISVSATSTTYGTQSDKRKKINWRDFNAGHIIDALEVWLYDWKNGGGSGYGVLAQDANYVFPDAVIPGDDWEVDYSKFVPLLLKEVKELRKRIAELESA